MRPLVILGVAAALATVGFCVYAVCVGGVLSAACAAGYVAGSV